MFVDPAQRQPDSHRPWSRSQVRVVGAWPTRRDQPVSVALSPAALKTAQAYLDKYAHMMEVQMESLDIYLRKEPPPPFG